MPLARRLWQISKIYHTPINDERIQDLNIYDIEFIELSLIADDPEKLRKLEESFYDDEYDEWVKEFEEEQQAKSKNRGTQDLPDQATIEFANKLRENEKIEDWEVIE